MRSFDRTYRIRQNIMMPIPHAGHVLVRPHKNNTDTKTVSVSDDFRPQFNFSVTGEVVSVLEQGDFFCEQTYPEDDVITAIEKSQRRAMSITFDVPIEIKVGDMVVFPYFYHIKSVTASEEHAVDGCFLIPYQELIARVDADKVYPLGGRVIGLELQPEVGIVKLRRPRIGQQFEIISEGCRVRRYADYGYPDKRMGKLVGKKVSVFPGMAVAPEADLHKKLGDRKLYFFHRRDILGYVQ